MNGTVAKLTGSKLGMSVGHDSRDNERRGKLIPAVWDPAAACCLKRQS